MIVKESIAIYKDDETDTKPVIYVKHTAGRYMLERNADGTWTTPLGVGWPHFLTDKEITALRLGNDPRRNSPA